MEIRRASTYYYIQPGKFMLMENAISNPDLIQSSVSSNCEVTIVDKSNFPLDDLEQWPTFRLSTTDIVLKGGPSEYNIYIAVPTTDNNNVRAASIGYVGETIDRDGYEVLADGERGSLIGAGNFKYYLAGKVTAQGTNQEAITTPDGKGRHLEMDLGVTPPISTLPGDISDYDKVFDIDKVDPSNPLSWLLTIIPTVKIMTARVINVTQKIVFGTGTKVREVTDVAIDVDSKDETKISNSVIASTAWANAQFKELDDRFLRKDQDDEASGLIKFLQGIISLGDIVAKGGITIGESIIDSLLAGAGIILKDGRIQADRMELRSSLVAMEVIFNRLSAMESDYSFSESGTIDSVQLLEDGTYNLPLRKRWDNDFTALAENDVVYGVVNDLASGSGNYYTSWLRVLHVDTSANTINAVMYPDSEVPGGKNYPPEPLMILSHRGNPVNEDRQGYWYLSSREKCICMLDGVRKPILEEYNYSVIVGKMKQLALFDHLPISYRDSYIFCRGFIGQDILQVNVDGVPIVQYNERSFWTATPDPPYSVSATIVDVVWHVGCKWLCLINSTTDEPMYGSTGWTMIEGNPEFTIDIDSSEGWNFDIDDIVRLYEDGQKKFTVLNVTGKLYNGDVTAHILDGDIEWTRNSGDVTEDNAWAVAHGETGKVLALSLNDLGPHYSTMTGCKFIARALLRDGQKMRDDKYIVEF